jgi:hypothetical protein
LSRYQRLARKGWTKNREALADLRTQIQQHSSQRRALDRVLRDQWKQRKALRVKQGHLYYIEQAINSGYAITHEGSQRLRARHMMFIREKIGNDYLSSITGERKDWIGYLEVQRSMVRETYELMRDENHADINIVLADTLLGHYIFSKKNLTRSWKRYNGGTRKRQRIYAKNIDRFYRHNKRHVPLPKRQHWLRRDPYITLIARRDNRR